MTLEKASTVWRAVMVEDLPKVELDGRIGRFLRGGRSSGMDAHRPPLGLGEPAQSQYRMKRK